MRNIKFRFWNKKLKLFEYDWKCSDDELLNDVLSGKTFINDWIPQQWTGLLDRHGKEIYEGDILRKPPEDEWDKENYGCYEVFFHDGDEAGGHIGFSMNRSHYHGSVCGGMIPAFLPKITKLMEVIGNIYENKDLLDIR